MTHKRNTTFAFVAIMAILMVSCSREPQDTGRIFLPDMTYSPAYETYAKSDYFYFDDKYGMTAFQPVEGTIARGMLPEAAPDSANEASHYAYLYKTYFPDSDSSYQIARSVLSNPLEPTKEVLNTGKRLYNINCAICHGEEGEGDGTIVANGAYPGVPPKFSTRLQEVNAGMVFHVITYGRNLMGSYSSQLDVNERWAVIHYIQKMAKAGPFAPDAAPAEDEGNSAEAASDTTATEG